MKVIRSTRCNLKYATQHKRDQIDQILTEYARVCNLYIKYLWERPNITQQKQLLKPIVDQVSADDTWFTFRLRKVALREALGMVQAERVRTSNLNTEIDTLNLKLAEQGKPTVPNVELACPTHNGKSMHVSSTIGQLKPAESATTYDMWLSLTSIGRKLKLELPIRLHKHYHKFSEMLNTERLESYIISRDHVQFCFKITTEPKLTEGEGNVVGIDTGIKSLATLSDGTQFGTKIELLIDRINRCQHSSKHQQRLRHRLKQYIDETVKSLPWDDLQLIVVERLHNLNKNTRRPSKITQFKPKSKVFRKQLGSWNYRYWLRRLQQATELNRVAFRTVSPYHTSQRCSQCGHTESANRSDQESFRCRSCGYTDHADINAARNILERFCSGPYGARYKPSDNINISPSREISLVINDTTGYV